MLDFLWEQVYDGDSGGDEQVKTCKGIVKGNVVILEEGIYLPDGAEVEVRLSAPSFGRDEAFARVLANRIRRHVGMDQIIEEDKQEREAHPDTWLKP
jgi:hypothetical protein